MNRNNNKIVYSQLLNGAFVANKKFQYRIGTEGKKVHGKLKIKSTAVNYPDGFSIGGFSLDGLYDISNSPYPDQLISAESAGIYKNPDFQNQFDTLFSYICHLKPNFIPYDTTICARSGIEDLVVGY